LLEKPRHKRVMRDADDGHECCHGLPPVSHCPVFNTENS
jgi:hypothetical protein